MKMVPSHGGCARPTILGNLRALFDPGSDVEILPLIGLALPYDDQTVDECRVLPSICGFSARYADATDAEVARVAKTRSSKMD